MKGAYYVAFGEPARGCVKNAIPTLKKWMPDIPVAVASSSPLGCEDIFIKLPDADIGGRLAKIKVYESTPKEWEYIIYMDADTEVRGDISFLFEILFQGWDMVICRHWGSHSFRRFRNPDNLEEWETTVSELQTDSAMAYQGGMFAFRRNARTKKLFESWIGEWQRWGKRDQAAFVRALHKNPIKLFLLPSYWNRRDSSSSTVIYHYMHKARRYPQDYFKSINRLDSREAWGGLKKPKG